MSWIIILIELIPAVLKIIALIRELIEQLPSRQAKIEANGKLRAIFKRNFRRKRGQRLKWEVKTSKEQVAEELTSLTLELRQKVPA